MTTATVPVSVIIPTYRRPDLLLNALTHIENCKPIAAEILVHIDANDDITEPAIASHFPRVRLVYSSERQGPGGGRNRLAAVATQPFLASFDDDSYPLDIDYFERLHSLFMRRADADVIASHIIEQEDPVIESTPEVASGLGFVGCGVAYRREAYIRSGGYIPLVVAYGMEEEDLALRLHASGARVISTRYLRVFHDTNRNDRHREAPITAGLISNLALLPFLRYPILLWPYGFLQICNRVLWQIRKRRFAGLAQGVCRIPLHLWRHRHLRKALPISAVLSYLKLRGTPKQWMPIDKT